MWFHHSLIQTVMSHSNDILFAHKDMTFKQAECQVGYANRFIRLTLTSSAPNQLRVPRANAPWSQAR